MSSRFRRPEESAGFLRAIIRLRSSRRGRSSFRQVQYFDPQTKQFHPGRHLLRHSPRAVRVTTRTRRSTATASSAARSAGSTRASSRKPATWARRRVGACRISTLNGDGKIEAGVDRYVFEHLPESGGMLAGLQIPKAIFYSVIAHPTDGSIWGAVPGPMPGRIVRIDPKTCVSEVYEPPFNNPAVNVNGYTPRGIDVDSYGVIWTALAGSGHLASFDRRKCRIMSGPEATTGQHCPEGWTLVSDAGPALQGRDRRDCRRHALLQLRRPLQHAGPRAERAARERHELRLAARAAARWALGRPARALSARLLLARHGRPHRRSQRAAGRAAASTPTTVRTRCGTPRAAKARAAPWSSSNCGPIRWPSEQCRQAFVKRAAIAVALVALGASSAARAQTDLAGHVEPTLPRGVARAGRRPRDRRLRGLARQRRRALARGLVGCGEVDGPRAAVRAAPGRLRRREGRRVCASAAR